MKVELIDYTGMGQSDPLWAARKLLYIKNTRLQRSPSVRAEIFEHKSPDEVQEELKHVVMSIRSSWEFVSWTFEVTGVSRACTDQILRTRHGSYAVQAMRVADMSDFAMVTPKTIRENPEAARLWRLGRGQINYIYTSLLRLGIPNQDARGILPMNIENNFNAEWKLNTMAEICGKRDNLRAQGEYTEFVIALREEIYKVMPWTRMFLEPERTQTPALIKIMSEQLGDSGPLDKPLVNQALKEIDMLKGIWG